MLVKTKAIVLQAIKYRDADLIVKCYTQQSGLKSYLLRGVLKSKKGKFRAAMFQPLTQLEIEANHKAKEGLDYLKDAKLAKAYQSLQIDVYKTAILLFLAESLRNSIQEEEQNQALFQFLEEAFNWLDQAEKFANFHLLFLVKLSQYLGFYPDCSNVELPYFNLLDGNFQWDEVNKYCISNQNSELLKKFLTTNFEQSQQIKLNQNSRKDFLEMLITYYQLHLQGFKKPKSIEVLNQLF